VKIAFAALIDLLTCDTVLPLFRSALKCAFMLERLMFRMSRGPSGGSFSLGRGKRRMIVACLWSHWSGEDEAELDSFAAITDEPPPEIAETGQQRCIISLQSNNIDEWLAPTDVSKGRFEEILSARTPVVYEHRKAA
jgi:hypothetical protein